MNTLSLSIQTPCSENYDQMVPQEDGRFCKQCAKTVVDFTDLSDEEVLNYLSNKPGMVCGRIQTERLQSPATISITTSMKRFLYAFGFAFLVSVHGIAQQNGVVQTDTTATEIKKNAILSGTILDEQKQPIEFASVVILKNGILVGGSKTDVHGQFRISNVCPGDYEIRIASVGYSKMVIEKVIKAGDNTMSAILNKKELKSLISVGGIGLMPQLDRINPSEKRITREQIQKSSR
jgi:hypothetical protein